MLLLAGCASNEPEPEQPQEPQAIETGTVVMVTDSDEWRVQIFKEHVLYSEVAAVKLPAPWRLPTREDAGVLRTLEFDSPSGERFVTSDGYTFGMPSASVSKAGSKTRYSVLGLWKRRTTIIVEF